MPTEKEQGEPAPRLEAHTDKQEEHIGQSIFFGSIMKTFSGLPLVGYERGAEVAVAQQVGFEDLGPLRVWTNAPA